MSLRTIAGVIILDSQSFSTSVGDNHDVSVASSNFQVTTSNNGDALTGAVPVSGGEDGAQVWITNAHPTNSLLLKNNVGSTVGFRFILSRGDLTLSPGDSQHFGLKEGVGWLPINTALLDITRTNTSNAAITSNTTLANVTGLSVDVEANKKYSVDIEVPFSLAGISSGYKFAITGPAAVTNLASWFRVFNGVTDALLRIAVHTVFGTVVSGGLASVGSHVFTYKGILENGSNAGTIQVQAAQNASDGSALTILRGGRIRVTEIV